MQGMISNLSIKVNETVFLKDPQSSDLGLRIIEGSIELIDSIGFEAFTFGKLAKQIGSTEASVYRYFESKHKLLLYLVSWYWTWMEYRLVLSLSNVPSSWERLDRAVTLLTERNKPGERFGNVDLYKLSNIVISESSKVYLIREVDEENKIGAFAGYKKLVNRVSAIIEEIRPDFRYPHMLVTTVIEGAHHQRFFAEHLPKLTDVSNEEDAIVCFYKHVVRNTLQQNQNRS